MAARKKIKVKDNESLVRDSFSKAIINVDRNAYSQMRNRKKNLLAKDRTIESLQQSIEDLKSEHAKLIKLVQSITKQA